MDLHGPARPLSGLMRPLSGPYEAFKWTYEALKWTYEAFKKPLVFKGRTARSLAGAAISNWPDARKLKNQRVFASGLPEVLPGLQFPTALMPET